MRHIGRAFLRLFAIQGSWNYESMIGLGVATAMSPLLEHLADERGDQARRAAIARASRFFNAHPYFAGLAVGAQARAEVDGVPSEHIERLRNALPGPLGSIGDRLIWAGWLPACVGGGLLVAALGGRWLAVIGFLAAYNVVHIGVRYWSLRAGWALGVRVSEALARPLLRRAVEVAPRIACFTLGVALPIVTVWTASAFTPSARWGIAALGVAGLIVLRWLAPTVGGLRTALVAAAIALAVEVVWL